ncbi:transposase, partial [Vibrio cionasavignyae]
VDLNPIRAGIAKTPETSEFTSIKARIDALDKNLTTAPCLHPFIGNPTNKMLDGIPFRLIDYIELVDWTARLFRENKASMDDNQPAILTRLNFNQKSWLTVCTELEKTRSTAVGCHINTVQAKAALKKSKMQTYQLE